MRYLVVDTETGGFDPENDALMSMGAILLDEDLNTLATTYVLFRNFFKRKIGVRAKEVNGLDEELLETAVTPIEFRPIWNAMSSQADILIGHNIAFDIGFLKNNGLICDDERTLDTMHLACDVWMNSPISKSLSSCYKRIGLNPENAHHALHDCEMVADLLRWFVENGYVEKPLPKYPAVNGFYERGVFGYVALKEKGLI